MEIVTEDFNNINELDIELQIKICKNLIKSLEDRNLAHFEFSDTIDNIKIILSNIDNNSINNPSYIQLSADIRNSTIKAVDDRIEDNINSCNVAKYKFKVELIKLIILTFLSLVAWFF